MVAIDIPNMSNRELETLAQDISVELRERELAEDRQAQEDIIQSRKTTGA